MKKNTLKKLLAAALSAVLLLSLAACGGPSGDGTVFALSSAVSDPVSAALVDSREAPGANITGTSDYLDTNAVINLIFAANPDADKIGLLYDLGQDSSATPIAHAKEYLDALGIA